MPDLRAPENRTQIGQWTDEEHLAAVESRNGREHWIIEREGQPAGYLIAYDGRAANGSVYLKRILVADKERGTGTEALRRFIAIVSRHEAVRSLWLIVRSDNHRAQHVYRKLGFRSIDPAGVEAHAYDRAGEPPMPGCHRMELRLANP